MRISDLRWLKRENVEMWLGREIFVADICSRSEALNPSI